MGNRPAAAAAASRNPAQPTAHCGWSTACRGESTANRLSRTLLMSEATVSGVVHVIEETKTYGQKGFRKRLVVLEQDNGRFTNYIPVDFIQDGCDTVDDLQVGQEVRIKYRLSGRKWQRDESSEVKYFLNAEAMGFEVVGKEKPPAAEAASGFDESEAPFDDDEEIPF
jgi:hypothetical protein